MMLLKLERMEKEFKINGHCCWNQDPKSEEYIQMKALRLTIYLLRRRVNRNSTFYAVNSFGAYNKKWGEIEIEYTDDNNGFTRCSTYRKSATTDNLKDQLIKELKDLIYLDNDIYRRDNRILHNLLEKYSAHWWD